MYVYRLVNLYGKQIYFQGLLSNGTQTFVTGLKFEFNLHHMTETQAV